MKVLVTGVAGFIGFHVARQLLERGDTVVGVDNLNDYYSVSLKTDRVRQIETYSNFRFEKLDIADRQAMERLFSTERFDRVVHLAAQAGVRYSLENPHAYVDSNVVGFVNILECCRQASVEHLVYASSSSVYGANTKLPFSVHDSVDHPLSLYAATKKANELMAHSYSHLYRLPVSGLRFFSVYGPWGRPDMAVFLFTKAILEGTPIQVFNQGRMKRDMTYISDIVNGVILVLDHIAEPDPDWSGDHPDPSRSAAPHRLYNIGNHQVVELMSMIETLERVLNKTANKIYLEMQPGDVPETYADVDSLMTATGFKPDTSIEVGIERFVDWYRRYFNV